jgi:hypothetical protein
MSDDKNRNTNIPKNNSSKKKAMTCVEYDNFLTTIKEGRFIRTGVWKGFSKGVKHKCQDPECAREWSPSPSQCLPDDYFCPSCVLHHRNNIERFEQERLKWTADVPNTFYVYNLTDPKKNLEVVKFGRTQHLDPNKRYALKERKKYKMKLLFNLRGKLKKMTKIENWWKDEAKIEGAFIRFSDESFHGLSETIINEKSLIERLIEGSKKIAEEE